MHKKNVLLTFFSVVRYYICMEDQPMWRLTPDDLIPQEA